MTTWAMFINIERFWGNDQTMLLVFGAGIFVLEIWLLFEAAAALKRARSETREAIAAEHRTSETG
jgi:hypothetical protein